MHLGSPTLREAQYRDLHSHGSRSMPEVSLCVQGKPDKAGGPVMRTRRYSSKPVYAGSPVVCLRKTQQNGKTQHQDLHVRGGRSVPKV